MSYSLLVGIFANLLSFNTDTGLDAFSGILAILALHGLLAFYGSATIIVLCKKSQHGEKEFKRKYGSLWMDFRESKAAKLTYLLYMYKQLILAVVAVFIYSYATI